MSLDTEVIDEIAAELRVAPAFVERDWYSVQALKAANQIGGLELDKVATGGLADTIRLARQLVAPRGLLRA